MNAPLKPRRRRKRLNNDKYKAVIDNPSVVEQRRNVELESNRQNCKEAVIAKLTAHKKFVKPYLDENKIDIQCFEQLLELFIKNITEGYSMEPEHILKDINITFETEKQNLAKTKALQLYTEIFKNSFYRFFGRSGAFIFEKL